MAISWIATSACDPGPVSDTLPEVRPEAHAAFLPIDSCAPCHPRQVDEYAPSPMNYAASSPVFAALELAVGEIDHDIFSDDGEGQGRNLCVRCHAPVGVAEGIGQPASAEGVAHRARLEDPIDQGITCDFCHRVSGPDLEGSPLGDGIANGALRFTPGATKLGPIADPVSNAFHHSALSAQSPSSTQPYLSSAEFCGACHDVRLPVEDVVRGERDLAGAPMARLENLFSEWQQSPWADPAHPLNPLRGELGVVGLPGGEGAVSHGEEITCQDCHMSLYPYRRFDDEVRYDEAFAGVDPSTLQRKAHKLYPAGKAATAEGSVQAELPRRRVSVHDFTAVSHPMVPFPADDAADVLAPWPDDDMARRARRALSDRRGLDGACSEDEWGRPTCLQERRADMLRAAVKMHLDEVPEAVAAEGLLSVPVWLENTGAGHNVPAGFSQEREVWVAMQVVDEGRTCTAHAECFDLTFDTPGVDDFALPCTVPGPDGTPDPVLADAESSGGLTREARMRRERSGLCDLTQQRCVIYRSGYLIDRDGDGITHDEDLRHVLVDLDPESLGARCVIPGPDADLRPLGLNQGIVRFTNAFQRVKLDEAGGPVTSDRDWELDPEGTSEALEATARALWDRHRFLGAPLVDPVTDTPVARSRQLEVDHPLEANRFFDGAALRPFEPRLALYEVPLPPGAVGPLTVQVRLRYRFFPPRLIRGLARRRSGAQIVNEQMLDASLLIVDMAKDERQIDLSGAGLESR
ncbi:MAG: hypothetical protein ACE366_00755 [Bradymonadia bacterium]